MEQWLYYLALLACPVMLIVMFWMMKGMMNYEKDCSSSSNADLEKSMHDLSEKNKQLTAEIENLKKNSR
ncbi:DUF2933 domain-containing protein [Alteribacillus bidgolensis]|uniref:DUF2933 domain-containing protein n=1 Tax=Alteribacillus bidgolensis TaxID=930129 RepID=A0A1G8R790_9BACI|nr:DUF2933 domain-containing protein [Alteribacillus bidgolensis]SDJ12856.1 hypothetical protein SAMN05216352_12522 [Alteribacillus bidgolensis]